ncbi:MAG: GNAT family N-acetyltransferase [Myxococcota bacterium]
MDDILDAIAVRSAVFIGEQNCPVREELDGNDVSSTHLVAYSGVEPVGSTRTRFFADFAQWGRLAVLPSWRGKGVSGVLARAAIELIRAKGYRRIYGQAESHLLPFYEKLGFRTNDRTAGIVFSGYDFIEIVMDINPTSTSLSLEADPYTIIRPEGKWHEPGVLEKSAVRGVDPDRSKSSAATKAA